MRFEPYIASALLSLKPGAEWTTRGDNYSDLEWLDKTQTKPTEDEVNAKVTELQNAEPYRLLRIERNRRLQETDWRASSDLIMSNEWKTYRQALRDLPKVHPVNYGDPKLDSDGRLDMSSVTWPTPPS